MGNHGGGVTDQLHMPHDRQLESDVLAALAREGDCRHLFDWLTPGDFYQYPWLYERLHVAHQDLVLCCETDTTGTRWRWRHLPPAANNELNRICATARTLGDRVQGGQHLRAFADERARMRASHDLYYALGSGDDQAAAEARTRLLLLEAS